ncbi:hypothetical protein FACS1894153_1840 [Bacteroidia bacterium]|nr:hypothetical protein FACS1894153_1840 [Bacteroidia bacterium]
MLKSMTGYGKVSQTIDKGLIITAEIKSLNSKQLDLSLKIPSAIKSKELELRSLLSDVIIRGKAEFVVSITGDMPTADCAIDKNLAKQYISILTELAETNNLERSHILPLTIKMPNVVIEQTTAIDDDTFENIKNVFNDLLKIYDKFRIEEGEILHKKIISYVKKILELFKNIDKFEGDRLKNIKDRIINNLAQLQEETNVSKEKIEQEMFFYIEKLDITEEKVRLKKHCDYFLETMNEENAGKKLGFITQEMGREINTIGSKANNLDIQKIVVMMKDELEKVKEQLGNIL